ncbi:hypothetical protein IW143_000968 [Coemansia sp. RSA 520]|nr:hypothetical protein IW144_000520 [Coemansia sp. RSA 522]KAJ2223508.1 hypothetical protein IW143_000968 [Coemansia sp. RSA 520]
MVTDDQFSNASFDRHSMEELSGFNSDGQTDHLSVNETMSDIGRVVSQGEAGMDFTTNMDAPLDGVWTKRPAGHEPIDDISMSRFAESYWKPQHDSDDLQSMEFSTHSADARAVQTNGTGRGEEETVSDSFLDQANGHSRAHLGSFHSDAGNTQQAVRALPRRPESYHPQVNDGSMFGDNGTSHAMPTFSSQRVPLERRDTRGRFARLAARYFQPESGADAVHEHDGASSDGISDIPGVPDTPDIHTMFASDQMSMTSGSPSPPPSARYPPVASASIVERTQTALQTRFKSMDEPVSAYGQAVLARAQSQPVMEGMSYRRNEPRAELPTVSSYQHMEQSRAELPTMSSYQRIAPNGQELPTISNYQRTAPNNAELPTISSYQHTAPNGVDQSTVNSYQHTALNGVDQSTVNSYQHMAFSMDTRSHESLDHPNLGSQGTHSPGSSFASREPPTYAGASSATPFDASRDHSFEHNMERFEPITNADTAFGDYSSNATSSIPDMDAILRDHEQVFNDLFPSDDDQGDYDLPPHTISNEFDVHKPPASLFASSASIVAEIGRRSNPPQRNRVVSSWDAHDVTPDAMRRQELQYGHNVHNPIEMLDKSNSLGIEDGSDVSGLLPESERSSFANVRTQPMTPRSNMQYTEPPPPTTPTTIVSRDTRHRPASRVLHNVPPFMHSPQSSNLNVQSNQSFSRRPAGPRALDPAASRRPPKLDIQRASPDQHNIRAAADFATAALDNSDSSSHGLGSLFHDSLPTLDMSSRSRIHRLGQLLPRNSPSSRSSNRGMTSMGHDGYEPFQDPTVDVTQLAKYGTVGMRHEWALSSQHKGVSADRVDTSVRKLPVLADREIRSTPSMEYESDEMVPTVRYDSTPQISHRSTPIARGAQTNGNEGPTLADIYELLKRTASSIVPDKPHDVQEPSPEEPVDPEEPVYVHPDVRPSAPTPRRSRHFPSIRHMPNHDDMSMRARAGSVHSRFQEFLRQEPDPPSMVYEHEVRANSASVVDRMSELALQSPPQEKGVQNDMNVDIGTLGQAMREHARMENVPVALAEKLLELATALTSARTTKTASTDTAKDQTTPAPAKDLDTNGVELRQLHKDIMQKFDECRTEVDMLRAEVRQGSTASHARTSSVVPHDSVSAVAANARTYGTPPHTSSRMMTPSPRPQSDVRPMYTVPTTAKNRQRHMVQWLSRQDREMSRNSHSPSPRAKHYRTTVQDVSDDDYDGALSDASTTVPGSPIAPRLAMRSPLPAINSRHTRGKSSQWTGNEELLETRHTLDSIRKTRKQAKHDDSFGDFVYDARMTRELAHTLAELQRAHERHFHARTAPCPVCASLKAQNHDPYLFGKNASAYKSMSTRELQKLLNAYVAAMETDNIRNTRDEALEFTRMPHKGRQAFTPTRRKGKAPREQSEHNEGPRMVLELLHEELAALSRRYHRMVAEYHALDPALPGDQRARRRMARELKDLVDLLDVKGEQISVLAGLHPTHEPVPVVRPSSARNSGCIERAYQSAKALQSALGDLY